jgi:hypothetical protein
MTHSTPIPVLHKLKVLLLLIFISTPSNTLLKQMPNTRLANMRYRGLKNK